MGIINLLCAESRKKLFRIVLTNILISTTAAAVTSLQRSAIASELKSDRPRHSTSSRRQARLRVLRNVRRYSTYRVSSPRNSSPWRNQKPQNADLANQLPLQTNSS